jgi:hypothetical protein
LDAAALGAGADVVLVATTRGKITATKTLKVTTGAPAAEAYTVPACIFTAKLYSATTSAAKGEVDLGARAPELFTFSALDTSGETDPEKIKQSCPINQVQKYAGGQAGETVDLASFTATAAAPGASTHSFKVGNGK